MNRSSSIVAIYPSRTAGEAAIKALEQFGLDMRSLSIVGHDHHPGNRVTDRFVLVAHASVNDTAPVKEILSRTGPESLIHHQ